MGNNILYQVNLIKENLVGGTIVDVAVDDENEAFGLIIKAKNGAEVIAWIDCDEEANGPGAINLQEA